MSAAPEPALDWHRRVVDRSLRSATQRSIDRGAALVAAAAALLDRNDGDPFTVQDVADEAGQSLKTLYQYFASKDDLLLAVFEEAMRAYEGLIRQAIEGLDEPVDRLAGALLAAQRLPERSRRGITRGLSGLRLQLTQADPELVERSQAPVTSLLRELVDDAVPDVDPRAAAYLLYSLNETAITDRTFGDGGRVPEPTAVVTFCLRGVGVAVEAGWLDAIEARLDLKERA